MTNPIDNAMKSGLDDIFERPSVSWLTNSQNKLNREKELLAQLEANVSPALKLFNEKQITYNPAYGSKTTENVMYMLLNDLNTKIFGYIDIIQEYIVSLRKNINIPLDKLKRLFEKLKGLALADTKPTADMFAAELSDATYARDFLTFVIDKVIAYVGYIDYTDKKLIQVCNIFQERVIPILELLSTYNQTEEGKKVIAELDLKELFEQIHIIRKQKENITKAQNKVDFYKDKREKLINRFKSQDAQPDGGGKKRTNKHKKRSGNKKQRRSNKRRSGHKSRRH